MEGRGGGRSDGGRDGSKVEVVAKFSPDCTTLGSGRRSYHRFVAATVSSLKKGTPRVLGGGKTSFPDIYFCLFKGPDNSLPPNNMGSFYVFPYTAV